jgi:hypothetical protein
MRSLSIPLSIARRIAGLSKGGHSSLGRMQAIRPVGSDRKCMQLLRHGLGRSAFGSSDGHEVLQHRRVIPAR